MQPADEVLRFACPQCGWVLTSVASEAVGRCDACGASVRSPVARGEPATLLGDGVRGSPALAFRPLATEGERVARSESQAWGEQVAEGLLQTDSWRVTFYHVTLTERAVICIPYTLKKGTASRVLSAMVVVAVSWIPFLKTAVPEALSEQDRIRVSGWARRLRTMSVGERVRTYPESDVVTFTGHPPLRVERSLLGGARLVLSNRLSLGAADDRTVLPQFEEAVARLSRLGAGG